MALRRPESNRKSEFYAIRSPITEAGTQGTREGSPAAAAHRIRFMAATPSSVNGSSGLDVLIVLDLATRTQRTDDHRQRVEIPGLDVLIEEFTANQRIRRAYRSGSGRPGRRRLYQCTIVPASSYSFSKNAYLLPFYILLFPFNAFFQFGQSSMVHRYTEPETITPAN